jgi:AraC-like DNA-binding protein
MNKHFRIPGNLALKLEEQAVPVAGVLRRAGLPQGLFAQTRVLVTTEELFALWRAIGEASPDPAIGLRLGTETRTERFHPSGLAALSTDNFRAALDHLARYKQLTCPEEVVQTIDASEWTVCFKWLLAIDHEPPALVDYCFAWTQTIGRKGTGETLSPLRLELVQPRQNTRALEQHFGCPIVTGTTRNALIFRAADATRPFITRNAELLEMLAPQFDQQLKEIASQDSLSELVRTAIQQRLTGHRPSIEEISKDLHMSSRTLQRRLQESGSSYQRVLDEARRQMARYYLGNSLLELNEAAYLLGYEDSNSFVRAFRTWEGIPPGLWRETHRTTAIQ